MSAPFRYEHDTRSPLDRSRAPPTAQSVNFKTNVNRMKTKKWVTAKKNAYDGDDWGDYDEYDEYGVNDEPQPEPQPPLPAQLLSPSQRYYGGREEQPRNFTDPSQPLSVPKGRRNSFERGEEQRAFSSSVAQPQQDYARQPDPLPALQTHMPPPPADNLSPSGTQFPPRKSSASPAEATFPRPRTASQSDKPLPFIRPADIYKRVEEERVRERASLDSARPSLDSLSPRLKDPPTSPQVEAGKGLKPLETVSERQSENLPDFNAAAPSKDKQPAPAAPAQSTPQVIQPEVASVFNSDFWSSGPKLYSPIGPQAAGPSSDERGLRSVVDQAFTRKDEQNSVPPTPVTKDPSSEMSRSNTTSTSGISPIMSRVPSSATSAVKTRNLTGADGNTPAIAEDPAELVTPVADPTNAVMPGLVHNIARKPSPANSRNVSSTSLPLGGTATPNQRDSPARSPVMTPQKDLPEPKVAQLSEDKSTMEGGLSSPSSAYAAREADIADAVKTSPTSVIPALGAAEKVSQDNFLESHNAQFPVEAVVPRDRSESPSKGRVQELAGKFDDASRSRRGSTQSKHSIQSWERSHENSRAPSPTKASPSKPSSPVKEFRPHLPGQWESYTTAAPTPMEHNENVKGLGQEKAIAPALSEDVDLTPTTKKRPVSATKSSDPLDPMAALKSAGAAMGESFRSTSGETENDTGSSQGHKGFKSHGDVYVPRPLQLDRTISAVSSIPPTPPAKDVPESDLPPPPPEKDSKMEKPETQVKQDRSSLAASERAGPQEEQDNDRLQNEIVASLGPLKAPVVPAEGSNRASLQPGSPGANRTSSILDSYWDDGDRGSTRLSQDVERNVPVPSSANPVPPMMQGKPSLLNRFSWEPSEPASQVPPTASAALAKDVAADKVPSPIAEHANEESESLAEPQVASNHVLPVNKPDAVPDPPSSPPGLHVVNTKVDPEAVEMPARLSTLELDTSRDASRLSQEGTPSLSQSKEAEQLPPVPISPTQLSKQSTAQEAVAKPVTTDKPLGAREIATITSTPERIATYNKTRDHWAAADHGLDNWLTSTLEANPELAVQSFNVPSSGPMRHKQNASVSKLGKLGGSGEQSNTADAQGSANATSPTTTAPTGSGFGGRITGQQKGKDLLHTAGVLGGKGVTSAKGLFAKGRSRFGRDKDSLHSRTDSAPSSREGPEDPGFMKSLSRASTVRTAADSDKSIVRSFSAIEGSDEKRRRRLSLSSSFHRVTRSRSRPTSMIIPGNALSTFDSTPKGTPPRELHRILGEDARPHSFHAPESWNFHPGMPPPAATDAFDATPTRHRLASQSRLGILPSPAKSAFSTQEKDVESDAPPVPPIPDTTIIEGEHQRVRQDDASHKILQSVIRHATPPVPAKGSKGLGKSALPDMAGTRQSEVAVPHAEEQDQSDVKQTGHQPPASRAVADVKKNDSDEGLKTFWFNDRPSDEDDEEDQRPTLNNGGLAVSTGTTSHVQKSQKHKSAPAPAARSSVVPVVRASLQEEPSIFAASLSSMQLDVSEDEDSDSGSMPPAMHSRALLGLPAGKPMLDISPLLPPLHLELDDVPDGKNGLAAPTQSAPGSPGSRQAQDKALDGPRAGSKQAGPRPAYETELIGGDVSPMSPMSPQPGSAVDEDATPTVEKPAAAAAAAAAVAGAGPRHMGEIAGAGGGGRTAEAARDRSLRPGHESPRQLLQASADPATLTHRVSATPLHVVHAVQEYAASDSSLSSWDHDSNAAKSLPASSPAMDRDDESDLTTPVAQQGAHPSRADGVHNGYFQGHAQFADPMQLSQHPQHHPHVSKSDISVPERSRSLLSQISAMVSDGGNPISPAPSTAGRSTPSTIRRMHYDTSTKNPLNPGQIPEESRIDRTPTPADDDDFDLYADHNGLVKGVRDADGQPLRIANAPLPDQAQRSLPSKTSISDIDPKEASEEGPRRRYSTERPMSFISGPPDSDGKPQDQINQLASQGHVKVPPVPEQYRTQPPPAGTAISTSQSTGVTQPHTLVQSQPRSQSAAQPSQAFVNQDNRAQATKSPEYNNLAAGVQMTSPPPQGSNMPLAPGERAIPNGQAPPNGQIQASSSQDPKAYQLPPGAPAPQGPPTPGSMLMPDHDPRAQGLPLGPSQGARNQYEFHQQMMQLQSRYPGTRGAENQGAPNAMQQPRLQQFQQPAPPEKQSTKTRLSSVFKQLGAKSQAIVQQPTKLPTIPMNPSLAPQSAPPDRTGSMHSGVSNLTQAQDQVAGKQGERPGPPGPPAKINRPPSFGAESHLSQSSTQVQPTDSRPDLMKPTSPAPNHGLPPQNSQTAVFRPGGQPQPQPAGYGMGSQPQTPQPTAFGMGGYPQGSQPPTSGTPEAGKKKRLSTLGGLFNRAGSTIPSKLKMSKEEKQAMKVQRHATAPPTQTAAQQWPPQQQQFRPQQPGMQYPPGQMPPQLTPGMRPMGPQFASPASMSPATTQGFQGAPGMPQQRIPQQYQQPLQQGFYPQQPMTAAQLANQSAYAASQSMQQQAMQQQAMSQQALQQRAMQEHLAQQRRQQSIPEHGVYNVQQAGQQFQLGQQPGHERGGSIDSQTERLLTQQRQQSLSSQGAYLGPQNERVQGPQQQQISQGQMGYDVSQMGQQTQIQRQQLTQRSAFEATAAQRQNAERQRQFSQSGRSSQDASQEERLRMQQQMPQQQMQQPQVQQQQAQQQQVQQHPAQQQQVHPQQARQQQMSPQQLQQQQVQQQVRQQQMPPQQIQPTQVQQQQQQQQRQQQQQQQQQQRTQLQPLPNQQQHTSGQPSNQFLNGNIIAPQRDISVPLTEPQYEAPPIPAAYTHVSGAFISPRDQPQQLQFPPANNPPARPSMDEANRQYSEPRLPSISPQLSAQHMPPNNQAYSDTNVASVNPPVTTRQAFPTANAPIEQQAQKQKMSPITENQQERPWHMDFPAGATEQEIVRARQQQFIGAQFSAQQQMHSGKLAQAAPQQAPPHEQTPIPEIKPISQQQGQGGGFKELLPRSSPQPYTESQVADTSQQEAPNSDEPNLEQPASIHNGQITKPADLPLPISPESAAILSPENPLASSLAPPPPPKIPHAPDQPGLPSSVSPPQQEQQAGPGVQHDKATLSSGQHYSPTPPPGNTGHLEQPVPSKSPSNDEAESHDESTDTGGSERPRPPKLMTDTNAGGLQSQREARERHPSIGILQHPQPASMAASPQRSATVDMGAEALRRQLLEQEEIARMERLQRSQMQRVESDRERREREVARARARELERSASGGGRVGSLRSVTGSRNGGAPGWERGSNARPVFELPAVEDDEPDMKATSYPGQEWVPPMWTDD